MGKRLGFTTFLLLCAALTLTSCSSTNSSSNNSTGGTGNTGGGGQVSTPGQAQGVYEGTTSSNLNFNALVLPNDTFYAIYGTVSNNIFSVCGIATGPGASASGNYTATETDFDYCGGSLSVFTGSVKATYTVGSSLSGSLTEGSTSETFSATMPANSLFDYSNGASIASISGAWSGSLTDGETASITVDSLGNVTGVSSDGCSFSATISPDSSGKNFFNISMTFGSSPCLLPNQSATGVAVNYLLSDGITNQLIAGVTSGNSFGIVFAAQR